MLTKSQARTFFLGGTVLFSSALVFLTVDTVRQTAARTNEHNLTQSVKNGKILWEKHNCMGCHTLLGEGGYYAPELTKVYQRRGPEWMKVFLNDPEAMFPGERKMPRYGFAEGEMEDLIAFFKWIGEIDTNGFPPAPDIAVTSATTVARPGSEAAGPAPEKFRTLCVACHAVGGAGGRVGPALDGVGSKFDTAYLHKWLADPTAVKPGTAMPRLPLSEGEREELVRYLSALK